MIPPSSNSKVNLGIIPLGLICLVDRDPPTHQSVLIAVARAPLSLKIIAIKGSHPKRKRDSGRGQPVRQAAEMNKARNESDPDLTRPAEAD
jgi:hypothetical protein